MTRNPPRNPAQIFTRDRSRQPPARSLGPPTVETSTRSRNLRTARSPDTPTAPENHWCFPTDIYPRPKPPAPRPQPGSHDGGGYYGDGGGGGGGYQPRPRPPAGGGGGGGGGYQPGYDGYGNSHGGGRSRPKPHGYGYGGDSYNTYGDPHGNTVAKIVSPIVSVVVVTLVGAAAGYFQRNRRRNCFRTSAPENV
ncbi:glycoprotein Xg isoform X13 [Saccopteryx leptura]|uniref:glycoprotein Xg isoform X13 n=1 Tax=Saccopteryx leptura TaxID=249018 RepID=UPI00339BE3C1